MEGKVDVRVTGCHGFCAQGPNLVIYPEEICYVKVQPEDASEIVSRTLIGKKVVDRLVYTDPNTGEKLDNVITLSMMRSKNFAKDYGVLITDGPRAGITARAVVVLDENDKVIYTELVPEMTDEPDYENALAVL